MRAFVLSLLLSLVGTVLAQPISVTRLLADDAQPDDRLGYSVAIDGDLAAVGAHNTSEGGAVYVFRRQTTGDWAQEARLSGADTAPGDQFGLTVALVGDHLLAGAPAHDHSGRLNNGAVYAFARAPGEAWTQEAKLVSSETNPDDRFGAAIAFTDEWAVVGAPDEDRSGGRESGVAYVFERGAGASWVEVAILEAADDGEGDRFGWAVALSDTLMVIGAPFHDDAAPNAGAAYVYAYSAATGWAEAALLTSPTAGSADYFGQAVAVRGESVLVGAPYAEVTLNAEGVAFLFEADAGWGEVQRIVPDAPEEDANFGYHVAMSDDRLLIGAPTVGVGSAGTAYTFTRSDAQVWEQEMQLPASDSRDDRIGHSVALSGDDALVGVPLASVPGVLRTGAAIHYGLGAGVSVDPELARDASLTLAPNPARGETTVHVEGARPGARLDVIDLLGRTVWSEVLAPTVPDQRVRLDGLPAGVYRVRLVTSQTTASATLTVVR